ncbi:MAG: septation protein SpoVG family protein [Ignavibacteria bacterium]|jgi:stage V sporulation protein G|nr:septation protein SpoVG family protein [Ignavibacteria bacterium]
MKILRINPLQNSQDGKLVAFFDFETNDGIVIKGFKIVNGTNGLFIAGPSEKGKDGKYYDSVILPKEMKEELQKNAIDSYHQKV